jgi:hypothetical protein
MIDQKQLEDVEYFKYLGSLITNDEVVHVELNPKATFNKKTFHQQI